MGAEILHASLARRRTEHTLCVWLYDPVVRANGDNVYLIALGLDVGWRVVMSMKWMTRRECLRYLSLPMNECWRKKKEEEKNRRCKKEEPKLPAPKHRRGVYVGKGLVLW